MPIVWADLDQETHARLSYLATLRQVPVQALAGILLRVAALRLETQVRAAGEPRAVIRRVLREMEDEAKGP
jgi:hypothetical protein